MSESRPTALRAPVKASLVVLSALLLLAVLVPGSAYAAKAPACPKAKAAKKRTVCHKSSTRPRYKTIRRKLWLPVPHTGAEQGVSEVVTVDCPHGEHVLGGGVEIWEPFLSITLSAPDEATTGWSAQIANLSTTTDAVARMSVFAICELEARHRR